MMRVHIKYNKTEIPIKNKIKKIKNYILGRGGSRL